MEEECESLRQEVAILREGSSSKEIRILKSVIKNLEVSVRGRPSLFPSASWQRICRCCDTVWYEVTVTMVHFAATVNCEWIGTYVTVMFVVSWFCGFTVSTQVALWMHLCVCVHVCVPTLCCGNTVVTVPGRHLEREDQAPEVLH